MLNYLFFNLISIIYHAGCFPCQIQAADADDVRSFAGDGKARKCQSHCPNAVDHSRLASMGSQRWEEPFAMSSPVAAAIVLVGSVGTAAVGLQPGQRVPQIGGLALAVAAEI